ncbi:Hypothetical predicted protein [Lecanosticta acicola]|uniref:SMP-30/Gluconolactonase/LRE-like region domain-containing protein n=1 Tax=Lecanosticta acicola TaxID=111012 RepID=A0AAI8YS60_9PEZI|nr:Hypothetical predicted protein [Lecanosticta acicola]
MDLFSSFFSPSFAPNVEPATTCLQAHDAVIGSLPASHSNVNAVAVNQNLAVIPGNWESGDLTSPLYDIVPDEPCVANALSQVKKSDFIAFDSSFLDIIGPEAKLERIQAFPSNAQNVHEAPVYLPETNELLYSDTSLAGVLFALNIDTHKIRNITLHPPLQNINGATPHPNGLVYIATNGGPVRGIFSLNTTSGQTTPLLNNYRGRHLNSPNDLIFSSSASHLYFTDPTYGSDQSWPGVQAPELPNAIYRFDLKTKNLVALSNSVIGKPNGLALSRDERTLYVADSSSTTFQLADQRAVFAFSLTRLGLLENPRMIHQIESGWPDGLRVTHRGYLLVAVAGGVDVLNPKTGQLLGKINAPDDWIFNLEPVTRGNGKGEGIWLLTGKNYIYKVTVKERGVERGGLVEGVQKVLGRLIIPSI